MPRRPLRQVLVYALASGALACGTTRPTGVPGDAGNASDGAGPDAGIHEDASTEDAIAHPDASSDGGSTVADTGGADALDAAISCDGPFTLTQQQPVSCLPYPASLWNKPLPADVMSHLAAGSDTIAAATFSDESSFSYSWPRAQGLGAIDTVTSDGDDANSPLYYGQATDPVYVVASCPHSVSGIHDVVGKTFHAPSGATFTWEGGGDSFFADWDQTDGTLITAYISSSNWNQLGACPGNGHAGTTADPCPVTWEYGAVSQWATDPGLDIDTGDSLGSGGWATHITGNELSGGAIHHALYLLTRCTVGNAFPATSDTDPCASGTTDKPAEGALFFLDYTPAQLADIKANVPLWQYELLEALTVYGGYVGDTSPNYPLGLAVARFEGPAAYNLAGDPYPLGRWLLSFPNDDGSAGSPLYCYPRTTGQECELNPFAGVPLETGPACSSTPCDVSLHTHLADPCVAEGLAGMSGGCN